MRIYMLDKAKKNIPCDVIRSPGPVVEKVDSAIHRINHYPLDSAIGFTNTYPLDSATGFPNTYPLDSAIGFPSTYPLDSAIGLTLILWIVIYPVDSAIQRFNNWGLYFKRSKATIHRNNRSIHCIV